jgi:hypothetical protein
MCHLPRYGSTAVRRQVAHHPGQVRQGKLLGLLFSSMASGFFDSIGEFILAKAFCNTHYKVSRIIHRAIKATSLIFEV